MGINNLALGKPRFIEVKRQDKTLIVGRRGVTQTQPFPKPSFRDIKWPAVPTHLARSQYSQRSAGEVL